MEMLMVDGRRDGHLSTWEGSRVGREYSALAQWLRNQLARRHMTQSQLAEAIGCERSTISHWVNDYDTPRTGYLLAIAKVFDEPPGVLYDLAGITPDPEAVEQGADPSYPDVVYVRIVASFGRDQEIKAAADVIPWALDQPKTGDAGLQIFAVRAPSHSLAPVVGKGDIIILDRHSIPVMDDVAVVEEPDHRPGAYRVMRRGPAWFLCDANGMICRPLDMKSLRGVMVGVWRTRENLRRWPERTAD